MKSIVHLLENLCKTANIFPVQKCLSEITSSQKKSVFRFCVDESTFKKTGFFKNDGVTFIYLTQSVPQTQIQ